MKKALIWILVGLGLVFCLRFRSDWQDQAFLLTYQPEPQVVALADNSAMTEQGRRLFYVSTPEIVSGKDALKFCQKLEKTVVLGCFSSRTGIYIKDIKDTRLQGVMEVTSAHEMLHVVYHRMDSISRRRIDELTDQAFARIKNKRIQELIASYKAKNPEVVDNELHSILGTEIRNLNSPELEAHYRQYLDREVVLKLAEKVEDRFASIEQETKTLGDKLDREKADLESLNQQVKLTKTEIDQDSQDLDNLRSDVDRLASSASLSADELNQARNLQFTFNQRVESFNARVRSHNDAVAELKTKVTNYNALVNEYNAIAREGKSLIEAIQDSTAPAASPDSKGSDIKATSDEAKAASEPED